MRGSMRLGVAAGLVGVVALVAVAAPQGNSALTLSVIVYGVGLLAMLIASALYNGGGAARHKDLLRRIDHAAIFVMIAGTYTPLVAMKMDGAWSQWLLLYVWSVALAGVMLKLIWVHRFPRLSVGLYLFLGWTIVVAFEPLSASMSPLGSHAAGDGWRALQRRRAVSPLGAASLPAADLARLRDRRRRLPLRDGHGRSGAPGQPRLMDAAVE